MRHTIIFTTLSSVVASVLTITVISGSLLGAGTASSTETPVEASVAVSPGGVESIIQGDVDCKGDAPNEVASRDSQAILRQVLEQNPLSQGEDCPAIGDVVQVSD